MTDEQLRAYARRWEQICALIHLDPERDPIHTVFEPWKDRREQVALAKLQAHVTSSAEAYTGDEGDHPFFGQRDAAALQEQHRVEKAFTERQVRSLQLELLRLRSQLQQPPTGLAVRRAPRQDVIDLEIGVEANCPRPGRALPEGQ